MDTTGTGLSPALLRRLLLLSAVCMLIFAGRAHAERKNPLKDPLVCGRPECPSEDTKFRYNTTVRYTYDYNMHVRTAFSGSGQNTSDVFVKATVHLTFPKRCEGNLMLDNIELREEVEIDASETTDESSADPDYYEYVEQDARPKDLHPRSAEFAEALRAHDLRFSFHDGVIGEVCPSDDEDNWILNFKKGILSAMQNSMHRFDIDFNGTETDVTGSCDVAYSLQGASGTSLLLRKTKDIRSCSNRYKTNSFLQTVPYDFRQNFAVWPILNSDSYCNISVDHHVYKEVKCHERHQLVPFSNHQSGAVTLATIHLLLNIEQPFDGSMRTEEESAVTTRSPLLFSHQPTPKPTHGEIRTSRDLLKKMCAVGFPLIKRDFIEVFTKFLQTTRHLSHQALYQLLNRASSICTDSQNGKYHVLESLPYIGSTASVQIMRDEIIKGTVAPAIVQSWLSSLSYLPRPDRDILDAFRTLLEFGRTKSEPKFVLVATAVTHTFCRNHVSCESVSEVQAIVAFLENELRAGLMGDLTKRVVRERIIVLLKGIGNIGIQTKSLGALMQEIVLNKDFPIEIRLQSIYANLRFECSGVRPFFHDVYENFDENSEVRIAAYQRIMLCPTYASVQRIKNILTHEEVNQVGSYVWSHLHNLAKSASPMNVEVQGLLVDKELSDKFKLDIRKFSRNFEQSVFFDEYNFGVRTDADMVFGTESYMPRRLAFNFTADLFGESVNLFELSTRMQGFEHLVESVFGPKGPLNAQGFNDKFGFISNYFGDNGNTEESEIFEHFNIRLKRDLNNTAHSSDDDHFQSDQPDSSNPKTSALNQLQTRVRQIPYKPRYNYNQPQASFGLKIFGNDIAYHTIEGQDEFFRAVYTYNPMHQLKALFSGKEINYTKSGVFLDVSYDVPLAVGLPLSINAFGASSVDLRMSGSLKDPNFMVTKSLDIEGKMKPSVSVDVTATMQSDYYFGSSGVRVKSNLYSSSSVDAKLKIKGTQLASLQFSLPQDRNDIFSARSEILVIKNDRDVPQKGIEQRYTNSTCTWPFIDRAVGLQVCSEYSLPDVNDTSVEYPSLILSGPISLNIHLDKADLSAKTFLFEYRSSPVANGMSGSLSFNTPDSIIPRVFSANVTTDPHNYNVSMSFRNGPLEHAAVGSYRDTLGEKKLELYLNLDGKKNLAFEMGVNRTEIRNGWIYLPRFLLAINNERIAGLMGTVKVTDKKNIIQYDINLTFETKRVQAQLMGYITQTEVSVTPKLTLSYLFQEAKKELVEIEGELANRSQKSRNEYTGFVRLNSTAYPKFNFATNMKFIQVLGHMELNLDYNNALDLKDPEYALALRIILAHYQNEHKTGHTRTTASVELTRPRSNLDFKFMIKHEGKFKNGPEHNILVVLRFAPKKEGTGVLSIHLPHSQFFALDAALNITVPAFDSCTVAIRLIEKLPNDYTLDFRGAWFSGHSVAVKGFYQDKSTSVKTFHHLKLVVTSPHFNETNIDMRFWREESELSFDLDTEHGADKYALEVRHTNRNMGHRISNVKLTVIDKIYSVSAQVRTHDRKQLILEIHVDKIRDIILSLTGISNDLKKEARVEVQWDANRDPTQKVAFFIELNTPNAGKTDGGFQIAYPERTFSGSFDSLVESPEWKGNARFGWSSNENIEVHARLGLSFDPAKEAWASIQLSTPFEGWTSNSIRTGVYFHNNLLLTNGSLYWGDNQHLGLSLTSNYVHDEPILKCEFKVELNSTVKEVPMASAQFKHTQNEKRIETDLKIKHTAHDKDSQVFSIRSVWQMDLVPHYRNITGSVLMRSPVEGYKAGALSTKFSLSDKKQLRGGLDVELDDKKYTVLLDGYAKKFTDNMFMVNITTPIEKFRKIVGRFGINEKKRHFVAEVRLPANALGVELLWAVETLSDFDIKFNVETPLEGFQKVMMVGKMKPETVDLRGGWNQIVVGYIGVWRMVNITDFEYSYKVYTPLEGFAENGFVAKFVRRDGFDMELSGKFSKYKLGIIANARPRPPLLRLLGLQHSQAKIRNELLMDTDEADRANAAMESSSSSEDLDEDEGELLNYVASMEVDTLVWPTIVGTLDLEEVNDIYQALGKLKLAQGNVEFRNRLDFEDYFNIKNTLMIITPFPAMQQIKARYNQAIEMGVFYAFGLELDYLRQTQQWVELGFSSNYSKAVDVTDLRTYDFLLKLKTPFAKLERIDFQTNLELDETLFRGNVSARTPDTTVAVHGSFESEENFEDGTVGISLNAPTVPKFACKVFFRKDLSDVENSMDFGFDIHENETFNQLHIETVWHVERQNYLKATGKLTTTLVPISVLSSSVLLSRSPNPSAIMDFQYATIYGHKGQYLLRADRKNDFVNLELITPVQEFGNVSLQGSVTPTPTGAHSLQGTLFRNTNLYDVTGDIRFYEDFPVQATLDFIPKSQNGQASTLSYGLTSLAGGNGNKVHLKLAEGSRFIQFDSELSNLSKVNLKFLLNMSTSKGILTDDTTNEVNFETSVSTTNDGRIQTNISLKTPWKQLGIDAIQVSSDIGLESATGNFRSSFELPKLQGQSTFTWTWMPFEHMEAQLHSSVAPSGKPVRRYQGGFRYKDSNAAKSVSAKANTTPRVLLALDVHLDVDSRWRLESNATMRKIPNEIGASLGVRLPGDINDLHRMSGQYRGNLGEGHESLDVSYDLKYETDLTERRYASRGHYRNVTDLQGVFRVEWGNDMRREAAEANLLMLRKNLRREFSARLATPMFDEDTISAGGLYDVRDQSQLVAARINCPASRPIANMDITFASLANMKGFVNCTTPFQNLTWLRGDFIFETTNSQSNRYLKSTWPKDTALFDMKSTYSSKNLDRDLQGTINMEMPLTTRHYTNIVYGLKNRAALTTGQCVVNYNRNKVLDGQYTCKAESRSTYDKEIVDITLQNNFKPLGISYTHLYEHSGMEPEQYDMKRAEIFDLRDSKKFNITGELHIKARATGQDYKVVAVHPNRTVILTSSFDSQEHVTQTNSKIQLADHVWLAYRIVVENQTQSNNESQNFNIELSYPKRNLSTIGWYSFTENTFDSDLTFKWTDNVVAQEQTDYDYDTDEEPKKPRIMRAALRWRNEPLNGIDSVNQSVQLSILHPSFQKDVTFKGEYFRDLVDLFRTHFEVEYCDEPDHTLRLDAVVKDQTTLMRYRNYTLQIFGEHNASQWLLDSRGSIGARPGLYEVDSQGLYQRSYLPEQEGSLVGMLDLVKKEIHYWKKTPQQTTRLWGRAAGKFPVYYINGSLEDSPDMNSTGRFYLNIADKFIQLNINMTPDASQNLRMVGTIPDARSASFDFWRDYEEIRVVDVAYYVRMNHSRLVTSQLIWRPTIKAEIKDKFKETAVGVYDSATESLDYWFKMLYTESRDTVKDVWDNAKPFTQEFLDDVGGLQVIEKDIEEFRVFINQSYESNDFYVKTVVNFTMTVLDELSIRDHIDSLPKILGEIWQVLGDSGEALRKSILWFIQTVKSSYKQAIEMVGRVFHGEALDHLTALMEKGVAQYDKIVKDLHVKFIKYVENMWNKVSDAIVSYWRKSLERIEPSLFEFVHHVESVAWNISQEIFDFLYKRTNEITDSPYFHKVSNFTHDLDRLYRDVMANDVLTNLRKYSALGWQFVKEKYFVLVPFGKEMNEIISELISEIKKLYSLEPVQFVGAKVAEIQNSIEWFSNEFQVEKRLYQLWSIVRDKVTRFSETALQTDDKYREAKTKFIFDPDVGLMELEQKLPMSWHAFNETPILEEIQEYRTLLDVQSYFQGSNTSLWQLYYEFLPYTDPINWMPPFKAHSLLIGSTHYMSFDRRFVSLNSRFAVIDGSQKPNQCSYLLAHDFVDGNFTLLLEPSITKNKNDLISTRKLTLITEGNVLDIDIIGSAIRVGRNLTNTLPIQIGDTTIFRDADLLIIVSSKGFHLNCNLLFDMCWFELGGWYFGKTAGLLGNMNNELQDDLNDQFGKRSLTDSSLVDNWAIDPTTCDNLPAENTEVSTSKPSEISLELASTCDNYFRSKLSFFANCFAVVDPLPFYDMCLDMGENAYSRVVMDSFPAHRGLCSVALAYIESCAVEKTPLRLPDTCIHCQLSNGSYVPEGTFLTMQRDELPNTTDVVFIVEAKHCNKALASAKNILNLVNVLQKELVDSGITKNRYSVMTFGGAAPFDRPRSIVHNNQIFTDHTQLRYFFEHIRTANQSKSNDVFEALSVASKLVFRAGAAKTFILIPCTSCTSGNMRFDYSSILQVMREEFIQLHILMDQEFPLDKKRVKQVLFGVDRKHAFTKRFLKEPTADEALRRQIQLPKAALGICVPLAIESNGTIFTATKLQSIGRNPVKKFMSVFAKRVAQTAILPSCQTCECSGHDFGTAYMTCMDCHYPSVLLDDYGFNDDEMLAHMQSGKDFDWDLDSDETYD